MLKLDQLNYTGKQPDLRREVAVFAIEPPPLEARAASARKLADLLRLGDLRTADLEHGQVMAGPAGDITVFHASGAVLARNVAALAKSENEFRKWPGLVKPQGREGDFTLDADASKRLLTQVTEALRGTALLGREALPGSVELEQVSALDAKGKLVDSGAGQACVKFGYRVEGLLARGAGAKTLAFAEPGQLATVLHAWRPLSGKAVAVKLPPALDASLGVGLLQDPELESYAKAGHQVTVKQLELVYLALPVFMRQAHLFPMWQVQGEVSEGKLGIGFSFGRFHHAAPPQAYADAGLFGDYLARNPDGITPAPARRTKAELA